MKLIVLCLLLLGTAAAAQTAPAPGVEAVAPFKKANALVIHTPDSTKAALRRVASLLQERGFAIDRIDYDLLSVSTKPKPFANSSSHTMHVLAIGKPGAITLTALWHGQMGSISVDEQAGITNAASKRAFAELEAVGKAYQGARVAYLQHP